ncbi:MAG: hypothetical protein WD688_04475 [Candidatus Binatia bacterium]
MAGQLNVGDLFPEYRVQTVDGRTLNLPHDFGGRVLSANILPRGLVTLL